MKMFKVNLVLDIMISMGSGALLLFGIVSAILYVAVVVVGGYLRPGYSHIKDTVSELFSPGSPNKKLLNIFIFGYSVSTILFGVGILDFVSSHGNPWSLGTVAAVLIILMGVINILTGFVFLQDPMGKSLTFSGKMHIVLVAVLAILSMSTPVLLGLWFFVSGSQELGIYSIITSAAILVSGLFTVIFEKMKKPILGLTERITIALFLQWSVAAAIFLFAQY